VGDAAGDEWVAVFQIEEALKAEAFSVDSNPPLLTSAHGRFGVVTGECRAVRSANGCDFQVVEQVSSPFKVFVASFCDALRPRTP
jgi:hypothetical protein